GDEAGAWRLEIDRADLHPLHDLVLQPFVVHLDIVVGVEVAIVVVVNVEMEPLGDQSAGPEGDVVVEAGGSKPAAAAGAWIQQLVGRAALISEPVGPQLEPYRSLEAQVGDPPGNA